RRRRGADGPDAVGADGRRGPRPRRDAGGPLIDHYASGRPHRLAGAPAGDPSAARRDARRLRPPQLPRPGPQRNDAGLAGYRQKTGDNNRGARDHPELPILIQSGSNRMTALINTRQPATAPSKKSRWRPFEKARAYAHTLGLKSRNQWNTWCKS